MSSENGRFCTPMGPHEGPMGPHGGCRIINCTWTYTDTVPAGKNPDMS